MQNWIDSVLREDKAARDRAEEERHKSTEDRTKAELAWWVRVYPPPLPFTFEVYRKRITAFLNGEVAFVLDYDLEPPVMFLVRMCHICKKEVLDVVGYNGACERWRDIARSLSEEPEHPWNCEDKNDTD
jgi:hypothetical protein